MCFEVPQLAFIFVRDYMKNLLVVLLATLSFNAYSYDNSNCAERNIISIAFTAEVFDSKNFDIAGEYKSYTNKLDNIAAKHKVKGYKIINQAFSMSNYGGFNTQYDIAVDDTYAALEVFYKNLSAASFSHRFHADTCID